LNEFANIVLNVAAETDSTNKSLELIVHHDDVAMVLSCITSVLTHGKADISLAKSTSITKTLTSNTDNRIRLAESSSENMLELRSSSVNEANSLLDLLLEPCLGLVILELPGGTTAFLSVLSFFHILLEEFKEYVALHNIILILGIFLHLKSKSSADDGELVVT
jgi:hypothetical protein